MMVKVELTIKEIKTIIDNMDIGIECCKAWKRLHKGYHKGYYCKACEETKRIITKLKKVKVV